MVGKTSGRRKKVGRRRWRGVGGEKSRRSIRTGDFVIKDSQEKRLSLCPATVDLGLQSITRI